VSPSAFAVLRCYGASGDEIASIGKLLTERWHPSAPDLQPMEPLRWTSPSSTSRLTT
jgi:hypothetical protein